MKQREGKRSPKDRRRQTSVARRRGERRAKRRGKIYVPDRWTGEHKPDPNPQFKLKGKLRGSKQIDVPRNLDCTTPTDWDVLCDLLLDLRNAALKGNFKRLVLNFHDVESLAPEAAITIVAEIQRCSAFVAGRTVITGTYPASDNLNALLREVGFFKALKVKAPELAATFERRSYVQIKRQNSSDAELADELLRCFSEVFAFEAEDRKRLQVAFVECMDNVFEHAYSLRTKEPDLTREWWLAGYADQDEGTIGFLFYDQGAGIPATIRARQGDRVKSFLAGWSDSKWIQRAVTKGISRHNSKRRGHGLEKLREFVTRLDVLGPIKAGSLKVVSNTGLVVFSSDGSAMPYDIRRSLYGTLAIWQLEGVKIHSVPDEHN